MKLMQLTNIDGETIYVNPESIALVTKRQSDSHATITMHSGERVITRQPASDVLEALGFTTSPASKPTNTTKK